MALNEKTSAKIAAQAAKIMQMDDADVLSLALNSPKTIRSIAASALTQAPDKSVRDAATEFLATTEASGIA